MNPEQISRQKLINEQLLELLSTNWCCDQCSDEYQRQEKQQSRKFYLAGPMKPFPFKKIVKRPSSSTRAQLGPLEKVTF